jgi:hypothetical protein
VIWLICDSTSSAAAEKSALETLEGGATGLVTGGLAAGELGGAVAGLCWATDFWAAMQKSDAKVKPTNKIRDAARSEVGVMTQAE